MSDTQRIAAAGWRGWLVMGALALAAVGLLSRAAWLTVHDEDFLQREGAARHLRVVEVPAHRGMITDRHGEALAVSTPVDSVWANPAQTLAAPERLPALAKALGVPLRNLKAALTTRAEREFVYLKRHLAPEHAARVLALGVPGVATQREYRRYYPSGEVAGHVLGFTDVDDKGQEGLELAYDELLRGEPGQKRVIKDRLGREVADVEALRAPRAGRDLRVSLDLRIQYLAYRELKAAIAEHAAKSGSVVVLDAQTGEVLAMANQPAFNPNARLGVTRDALRNRAATDMFEPGSAFKPFPIAAALETGEWRPRSLVDTRDGFIKVGSTTLRDEKRYGLIDVTTVLTKSVNTGSAKIALSLSREHLWETLARFGFGSTTGSGFPGEAAGSLPHHQRWRNVHVATLSYGYGLSATPLQLAQAYAVIAADGVRRDVSFVPTNGVITGEAVVTPRTARELRDMMETVVSNIGTATQAAVKGYRVTGKTGTARKAIPGGYDATRHYALFAGMAPASHPRLVTVVVVEEPRKGNYHGGDVAAPVFSRVMTGALRLLDVPPDGLTQPAAQPLLVAEVRR
jgi:cell division protein FtsI (penicillin-binding protein 3)